MGSTRTWRNRDSPVCYLKCFTDPPSAVGGSQFHRLLVINVGVADNLTMTQPRSQKIPKDTLTTELLILPDSRILVHNLTQPFAELLRELNPGDEHISPRATRHVPRNYELPN